MIIIYNRPFGMIEFLKVLPTIGKRTEPPDLKEVWQ